MTLSTFDINAPQAIILAAGQGKRMGGDLPKVLHPVAGRPMLQWVVDACEQAGVSRCIIVVGYKADEVRKAMVEYPNVCFVEQTEQLGTAHAADMARSLFVDMASVNTFVLAGDGPLIRSETLIKLLDVHRENNAAMTMATSIIEDPAGYGRIVRDIDGNFVRVVEQKDANEQELTIREVNPSYYCFQAKALFEAIDQIGNENQQREYYITDAPATLQNMGRTICVVDAVPSEDVLSINNEQQLAEVDAILRKRLER